MSKVQTNTQTIDGELVLKETMDAFVTSAFIVSVLANVTVFVSWLAATLS